MFVKHIMNLRHASYPHDKSLVVAEIQLLKIKCHLQIFIVEINSISSFSIVVEQFWVPRIYSRK